MPLEHLLAALERDATAQADALLADARAEAARITADAEARIAGRRRDVLGARERELRAAAEVALGEARRAARRTVLEARQRLLDRTFAAARGLFPETVLSAAYRAALPQQVAAALRCIGDVPAVIRCREALVPAVREIVAGTKHVSVESDAAAAPGFRLVTTDGAVEVDGTLDGRLERATSRLALAVLEQL